MQILQRILADGLLVPIVGLGVIALLRLPTHDKIPAYSRIVFFGLLSFFLARVVGYFFQPSDMRPFEVLGVLPLASTLNNPGFPSDHVLFASAITLSVWLTTKNKSLTLLLSVLVLLMGWGRVLALVHTPLDILGGVIIALLGFSGYFYWEHQRVVKGE